MALDSFIGWGVRQCGGGGDWPLGVEEVHSGLTGGTKVGAVVENEIQVGIQGVFIQKIKPCHFYDVVLLNGAALEPGGEVQDGWLAGG